MPLFTEVVEIDERITAAGEVLRAPDAETCARQLQELRAKNIDSLAICLLHAYRFREHEELMATLAQSGLSRDQRQQPRGAVGKNRCPRRHNRDGRLSESRSCAITSAGCGVRFPPRTCES